MQSYFEGISYRSDESAKNVSVCMWEGVSMRVCVWFKCVYVCGVCGVWVCECVEKRVAKVVLIIM